MITTQNFNICQKSISRNFHIVQNVHQPFLQLARTAHAKKKTNIYYTINTTSVYRKTFYFSTYKNCTHYVCLVFLKCFCGNFLKEQYCLSYLNLTSFWDYNFVMSFRIKPTLYINKYR